MYIFYISFTVSNIAYNIAIFFTESIVSIPETNTD